MKHFNSTYRGLACLGAIAACAVFASPAARAQDVPGAPVAQIKPAAAAQKGKASDADAGLRQRVEHLEEQLVDLQVVIGTLESLARSGGAPSASQTYRTSPSDGGSESRIQSLETQIQALTSQVDQLSGQAGRAGAAPTQPPVTTGQFGSTTVTSSQTDDIGGLIGDGAGLPDNPNSPPSFASGVTERVSPAPLEPPPQNPPGPFAAIDPTAPAGSPKQDYERAYGYLLQQDYGAAQAGFTAFLKQYPKDSLVPNALYWLGETHYVQKNFADAAEAFDIVTQAYGSSSKAPDSQLKRGMSLAQTGKKQEACAALGQLGVKYPSAPQHVKSKADTERQRIGCP